MLVREWMTSHVVTVGDDESVQTAVDLMQDYDISMLPVTRRGKLIGIVTDRDIKRAMPSTARETEPEQGRNTLARIRIHEVMSRNPITVPLDFTMEETAQVLLDNKISGCPVRDRDGTIVGVVTKSDLFRAVISVTGLHKKGLQIGVLLEDRSGSIREVTDVIRLHGGRLVSVLTSYETAPRGYRNAYIRAFNVNGDRLTLLKQELKRKCDLVYMVDHRGNERELF